MKHLKKHIGIIGLILGFLGISIAIFEKDIAELITKYEVIPVKEVEEKPLVSISLGDKEISFGKSKTSPKKPDLSSENTHLVRFIYSAFGLLAIVAGIIAWIRKENLRICGGAVSVGLIAVAWQYVLIGVAIAVILFVIANGFS